MQKIVIVALIFTLVGCGEISYKRGASGDEYTKAQKECALQGGDASLCMQSKGWQKPALNGFDPLFATVTTEDSRPLIIPKTSAEQQQVLAETVVKTTTAESKAVDSMKSSSANPQSHSVQANQSTLNDAPDTPYSINSWWKRGGFPDQLSRDQKGCEQTLGEAYLPDYKAHIFKRLFIQCMHEKGWQALRNIY